MPRDSAVSSSSAVGVRDIARRLGISVGTVDRALNDKPGIKSETRARVLVEAETMGYRPNLAARYLRSGRQQQILVYLPDRASFFWDTLRDGVREAAAPFEPSLRLVLRTYSAGWTAEGLLARPGLDLRGSGLIVGLDDDTAATLGSQEVRRRPVPIAYVAKYVADNPRILSVCVEPFAAGALAGELMGRFLPAGGKVAIVTGSARARGDAAQLAGFASSLSKSSARVTMVAVVEGQADERETSRRIRELLNAHPRLNGLYIGSSEALPVLRALGHEGGLATPVVVASDLSAELIPWIRSGKVAATIYQRPLTQGHMALRLLYKHLQSRLQPTPSRHGVAPYAVMNSNLDIVLQRLAIARASTMASEPTIVAV
jgi:LacI family transcriptional regulator